MADADCIYPKHWVDIIYKTIKKEETPRCRLFSYEKLRDTLSEFRHLKRPHLNSLGMSIGYPKELGLKIGFDTKDIVTTDGSVSFVRWENGRM